MSSKITVLEGDNIDILPTIEDESIDAVITDPPYNLGFMGKGWDKDTVAFYPEFWEEVMRTMKPGAHLLAFGHSRMFHRLACAIEDAGFEIRDTIMWLYGSGFPKSLDVSKAIDKSAGAERTVLDSYERSGRSNGILGDHTTIIRDITAPATVEAAQWQGWGTALKPAFEPIIVARKPLGEKTVVANVLAYGTGAINIDACRIGDEARLKPSAQHNEIYGQFKGSETEGRVTLGRHPANVIHDGSEEVEAAFAAYGGSNSTKSNKSPQDYKPNYGNAVFGRGMDGGYHPGFNDSGTASRFFYSAKATDEDRENSKHPTVKPYALMQWLCKLVTPPGGTILDCFAGTGSTLVAARALRFNAIGIEKEHEYILDIHKRLEAKGFF